MKYKINNEKFLKIKQQVIDSANYFYEEIGLVKDSKQNTKYPYVILVDDKAIFIKSFSSKDVFELSKISQFDNINNTYKLFSDCFIKVKRTYGDLVFCLTYEQRDKILNYQNSFRQKVKDIKKNILKDKKDKEMKLANERKLYVQSIENNLELTVKQVISLDDIEDILANFITKILNNNFKDITLLTLLEDEQKAKLFSTKKVERGFYITEHATEKIKLQYDKLCQLFVNRGIFDGSQPNDFYHLIITMSIRHIISKVYGKEFEKSYLGYFIDIENMTYMDCIQAYFSIDLINPLEESTLSLFTYFLILHSKLKVRKKEDLYYDGFYKVKENIQELEKNKEMLLFEKQLVSKEELNNNSITIDDIDILNGHEFESFTMELFKRMGYSTQITKKSGDQGIDVIAVKNGIKYGIQSKCYSNQVSNKAIQEVVAGISYYKLDKGLVITNNFFTDSAVELAYSNNIILWDRNILKEKLIDFFVSK